LYAGFSNTNKHYSVSCFSKHIVYFLANVFPCTVQTKVALSVCL